MCLLKPEKTYKKKVDVNTQFRRRIFGGLNTDEIPHVFSLGEEGFIVYHGSLLQKTSNPRTLSDMARFYNFPKEEAPRARGGKTSELGRWEAGGFCMFLLLFLKGKEVIWTCFSSTYLVVSLYSKVGGCTS